MRKPLPPPAHLAAAQPEQQGIPVATASGAPAGEAQFEDVALEVAQAAPAAQPGAARMGCFGRRQPQPAATAAHAVAAAGDSETGMAAPPAPGIHASSLLRKLSNGAGVLGAAPASQGPTPRIGAVPAAGFGAPSGAGAQPPTTYDRVSSLKEGGGYTQLELRAMPASSDGGAALTEPAKLFMAAGVGAPSSASVTSIDSDSEADGEATCPACCRPLLLCECLLQVLLQLLPAVGMLPLTLHAPFSHLCRPCWHLTRPGWGCLCDHASA